MQIPWYSAARPAPPTLPVLSSPAYLDGQLHICWEGACVVDDAGHCVRVNLGEQVGDSSSAVGGAACLMFCHGPWFVLMLCLPLLDCCPLHNIPAFTSSTPSPRPHPLHSHVAGGCLRACEQVLAHKHLGAAWRDASPLEGACRGGRCGYV
jgi:hypothetical protein